MKWAYGVTTVPKRRRELLPRTLSSLARAGFDSPRLFVDGPNAGYELTGLPFTIRWKPLGAFANWWLGLLELYAREPAADRYAMFQDDVAAVRGLREYLEGCQYPSRLGYWNLFAFRENETAVAGKEGWVKGAEMKPGWQAGRGALGLVFDREAVVFLAGALAGKPAEAHRSTRGIDGAVVTAMNEAGRSELVHAPSLLTHLGTESTVREAPHELNALSFPGEEFDVRAFRV